MPKIRKERDPEWSRKRELEAIPYRRKTKKSKLPNFSNQVEGLLHMNAALAPYVKPQEHLKLGQNASTLFSPAGKAGTYQLTTPIKGFGSSGLSNENGDFRLAIKFKLQNEDYALYVKRDICPLKRLDVPSDLPQELNGIKLPEADFNPKSITITKDSFDKTRARQEMRKTCGQAPRKPDNRVVMGNLTALQTGQALHLAVQPHELHWTHLLPHALVENEAKAQHPANMGLATRQANAAMELVNGAITKIFSNPNVASDFSLTLTATPTYIHKASRLLENITYSLNDNHGHHIEFDFDMLSQSTLPKNTIQMCEDAIMHTFFGQSPAKAVELATPMPKKVPLRDITANSRPSPVSPTYDMLARHNSRNKQDENLQSPRNYTPKRLKWDK